MLALTEFRDRSHIPIHALSWSIGIATLGSECFERTLDFRNAHAKIDVLQPLAPPIPVASTALDLHALMVVGDIPIAV